MREIKFRSWDLKTESFRRFDGAHDTFIINSDGSIYYYNLKDSSGGSEYVLEQFTGLHDKNGKEIYEGDIVFSKGWNPQKQEVTFDRGGFCLKYAGSGYYPDIKYAEQMEVIGTIHDKE